MPDAMLEIWQANAAGRYAHPEDVPRLPLETASTASAAPAPTPRDASEFVTVKPGPVPGPGGQPQAPHIESSVFARGLLKRLVTRIYFPDEAAANDADPCSRRSSRARRADLVGTRRTARPTVRRPLQGDGETVFFDV